MGYRVKQGACVCSPNGITIYRAGEMLPAKDFNKKQIDEHLRSGYIEEAKEATADTGVQGLAPGQVAMPPLPGLDSSDKDKARTDGIKVNNSGAGITTTSTPPEIKQDKSLWVFDPQSLAGKTLDQLNTLVKETDPKVEPFTTVEEAIAFLSQDFGK